MTYQPFKPAKRSLGQNFLVDEKVINRIVESLGDLKGETVVEIGPGRGAITEPLILAGANLTVVEKDTALAREWHRREGISVIEADFLELDLSRLSTPAKLIGNLPYNISTAILESVADYRERFPIVVFMFQREVADRIVAKPSSPDRGFLSLISQAAFEVERLFDVAPAAFRPQPKVWSTVVRFEPKPQSVMDDAAFRRLVSISFRQRRKTLANNLKSYYEGLDHAFALSGIDSRRRAESLTLDEWLSLYGAINPASA